MARKLCHLRAVWIFNIHWLDNTDQSLVIVDGGNRGTMKKSQKVRINLQQTEIADS